MNDLLQPTTRRTLLQRGLVLVAGAFGLQLAEKEARGDPTSIVAPTGGKDLRLYARRIHTRAHGQQPGELPAPSARHDSHCELLAQPNGKPVGDFSATGFRPESTAARDRATGGVELHTLRIHGDSLFGIGSGRPGDLGSTTQVVLGGTGRFAGARGTYVIREIRHRQTDAQFEFVINLLT